MTSAFSEHAAANYFLHTGAGQQGRPSMGSWVSYGLGSECRDLPGFVVLNSGKMPIGGPDSFNSGFLPATYQGSVFRTGADPVAYIKPARAEACASSGAGSRRCASWTAAVAERFGARRRAGVGRGELRDGVPDAVGRARVARPGGRVRRRPAASTGSTLPDGSAPATVRRELPEGPAAGRARRAVRRGDGAELPRRLRRVGRPRQPARRTTRPTPAPSTSRSRRC